MSRNLMLTSPYTTGPRVTKLQNALKRNKYGAFYHARVDGEYGPFTAMAVRRAKRMLGYPKNRINGSAGPRLLAYLSGKDALPAAYAARRRLRIQKAAAAKRFRGKVIKIAKGEIGTVETPVNMQPYGRYWLENGVAWCGLFVCWVWKHAGADISRADALRWDYCPQLLADAKAGYKGLRVVHTSDAGPGDAVLFDFTGDGIPDHVALVKNVIGGVVHTIEGNTSPDASGSQANGGGVWPRERRVELVAGFVRLDPKNN